MMPTLTVEGFTNYKGKSMEDTVTTTEDFDLNDLVRECMDAEGYVLGLGVLTKEKDKDGFNIIEFKYRRFRLSLEDTKTVIGMFKEQFNAEVKEYFERKDDEETQI